MTTEAQTDQYIQPTATESGKSEFQQLLERGDGTSIFNRDNANHMMMLAKQFAKSSLVPQHFQGKPEDCFIGLQMAARLKADPFMVLQSLYVVHGRPGFSAQFMIAMANKSKVFKAPIMFRQKGDGKSLEVEAYAIHAATGEEVSFTVSMAMAEAEGWTKNPKYKTLGALMLRYRSAALLIRTTCPEVTLGIHTVDELQDMTAADVAQFAHKPNSGAASLANRLKGAEEPAPTPEVDDEISLTEGIG